MSRLSHESLDTDQRDLGNQNNQNNFTEIKYCVFEFVRKCRSSPKLVLLVVFIALFFDNMLLTTIGKL